MEERKGGIEKNKRATRMELKVKGRAEGGPDHTHREATGTPEGTLSLGRKKIFEQNQQKEKKKGKQKEKEKRGKAKKDKKKNARAKKKR